MSVSLRLVSGGQVYDPTAMSSPGPFPLRHPRYEALALPPVGAGSQGVVVRVRDREEPTRALVAKLLVDGTGDEASIRDEFAVLARLSIRGVARVRDLGRDEISGRPFLVADYVADGSASAWLAEVGAGPARSTRISTLLAEAASVLVALHDAGIVHGDIKPAHLRMGPGGFTLLDLGSALSPALGIVRGGFSPAFAAPEILAGEDATPAADLFGLGASVRHALGVPHGTAARAWAPWLSPSVASLLDRLVRPSAVDRPASALELLTALGKARGTWTLPPPIGREAELAALLAPFVGGPRVRCLVGPPASGKSHLLFETRTALLLAGREARLVRGPEAAPAEIERARSMLEGDLEIVLLVDDLSRSPRALREAVERFVWARAEDAAGPRIIVSSDEPVRGASMVELRPLEAVDALRLAKRLGAGSDEQARALVEEAAGRPGWLSAAIGRVPLSAEAVRERAAQLPDEQAVAGLFAVARAGGSLSLSTYERVAGRSSQRALEAAGLVTVRAGTVELRSRPLAAGLADALEDAAVHALLAESLLASDHATAAHYLACATQAGNARRVLLERAREIAMRSGDLDVEIAAALALLTDGDRGEPALLARLERKSRDEAPAVRSQILSFLDEAAEKDPRLEPLAKRRRADDEARAGNDAAARALAREATLLARTLGDLHEQALSLATEGAVALLAADWITADGIFVEAERLFGSGDAGDPEERARLSHNRGAVALYRGDVPAAVTAFEDALVRKRALHDRAGVRSCLSNLALAEIQRGAYAQADALLDQAISLAKALGQSTGLSWCLGARAQAAIARGRFAEARDHAEEALSVEGIPSALRADLSLHRADALVGLGLADEARRVVEALPRIEGGTDHWVEARTSLVLGRIALRSPRDESRGAARLALRALRAGRRGSHAELCAEATALLSAARRARLRGVRAAWDRGDDESLDAVLLAAAAGADEAALARLVLAPLIARLGAERGFLVQGSHADRRVFGFDLDGLPLAEASARVDETFVARLAAATPATLLVEPIAQAGARLGVRVETPLKTLVLLVEHRFDAGLLALAEDPALAPRLHRWALLAAALGAAPLRSVASGPPVVAALPTRGEASPHGGDHAAASPRPRPRDEVADLEATVLPGRARAARTYAELVGQSEVFREALGRLTTAIESDLPVLVFGETGTGKELFAQAIHRHGARAKGPFVAVSCAAIADTLFEGELFGHARGSFTGADRARSGLLARAEGGVLFLDEIGELPLLRQATLLRALETRRFRPVGSDEERAFDVRILAATNRDLDDAVRRGAFRSDLLHRLRVLSLVIAPLRERRGDVALLFAAHAAKLASPARLTLSSRAQAVLDRYPFPGNVRELRHLIEGLDASGVTRVEPENLPRGIRAAAREDEAVRGGEGAEGSPDHDPEALARAEIERALAASQGNITHAAAALGLTRHGLKKRMARVGVRRPHEEEP